MVKLLTFNTWKCDGDYDQRLQTMHKQIAKLKPDVIALQECFESVNGEYSTIKPLAENLNYYYAQTHSRRKQRAVHDQYLDSYSSLALLSKYPIEYNNTFPLITNSKDGGRDALIGGIKIQNRKLLIANVHLSHLNNEKLKTDQFNQILSEIFKIKDCHSYFMCGDFNMEITHTLFKPYFSGLHKLIDTALYSKKYNNEVTLPGKSKQFKGAKIDHILYLPNGTGKLDFIESKVVLDSKDKITGVFPSDHFGVMLLFNMT